MNEIPKPFVLFDRWLDWPTRSLLARALFIVVLVAGCFMGLESAGSLFEGSWTSGWVWVLFILAGFGGWARIATLESPADEDDCKECKTCQARKRERMRGAAYDPYEVLRSYPLPLPVNGDLTVEDGAVSMSVDTWRAFWEANAAL